jgi:hypothetical protein
MSESWSLELEAALALRTLDSGYTGVVVVVAVVLVSVSDLRTDGIGDALPLLLLLALLPTLLTLENDEARPKDEDPVRVGVLGV